MVLLTFNVLVHLQRCYFWVRSFSKTSNRKSHGFDPGNEAHGHGVHSQEALQALVGAQKGDFCDLDVSFCRRSC